MRKTLFFRLVVVLTITNFIWAFGYAFVGDVYPEYKTLQLVLALKSWANGFALTGCFIGWLANE